MASRNLTMIVKLPLPKKSAATQSSTASGSGRPASPQSPAPSSIPSILNHLTQSHLVLALTIQKSKPEGLSIKEYCDQLQNHIKHGPRNIPEQLRYVDTTEFWKDQCAKVHLEKKALEDKLRCAEESNRLLRQALQRSGNTSESEESIGSPGPAPGPLNPRKRPSPVPEHDFLEEEAAHVLVTPLAADELLRLSSYVLQLKQQRSRLEEAGKESNTIDQINGLATETTYMLALLDTSFFDCCLPFFMLKTTSFHKHTLDMVQRVIHHVGISFLACFKAFNELCRTIPGRSKKSEFVFQLVMFFKKSLDFLKTLSNMQAEQEDTPIHRARSSKRSRVEEGKYVVNEHLAKMLSLVAYGLEWKVHKPGHSDLLEGILFYILEHTGRLLSEAIFEEHVAASDNPGNISKSTPPYSKEAARIEARYIVQILHAALGGDKRKELVSQILSAGRTPVGHTRMASTHGSVLSGDLLLKARKLLQSTLMKTAVGGEELESLRLPTPPLERMEVSVPKGPVVERYGPDWLVETVWALVGWDLVN